MVTLIFSSQAKLAQSGLKKELQKDHPDRNDFNFVSFDMPNTSIEEAVGECEYHSLTLDKKIVVMENCYFLAKGESSKKKGKVDTSKLLDYLSNPDPDTDLYLTFFGELDLNSPLVAAIKKNGSIKECKTLAPNDWINYIISYFVKRGCEIDMDAAKEIYSRTNGDYSAILNESNKLLAYKNGEKVTYPDVCEIVSPRSEEDSFKLSNALIKGDVPTAMRIYKDLKFHSVDEVALIGLLTNQFIFMDKVKYLDDRGLSPSQIAKELNGNQTRIEITLRNLYKIKSTSISRILEDLYKLDAQILTGEVDSKFAFSLFLANFKI